MTQRILRGCESFRYDAGEIGALLQHGFTGCPASMHPFGMWLSRRGVSVVGPRLPGHGTTWEDLATTTARDWERESEAALLDLASRCSTVIAVGLSFGGALVLHLAAKHPDKVKGVVAINAYVNDPRLALVPLGRLLMRSRKGVGNDVKKPGQDEIAYARVPMRALPSLSQFIRSTAKELPSIRRPLLVFSSREDHTVKPANSRLIYRMAGSERKEFIELTNSYHVATLDYDAETIFERTLEFARSLAQESSG
jgi:carboxylesterase